jgi:hypothetical protein
VKGLAKILGVLAISVPSFGCSEFQWQWTAQEWIDKPDAIYHGKVVAIRAPSSYIHDGEVDPVRDAVSFRGIARTIELKTFETLKGPVTSRLEITLQPCEGGLPNYLDEVILFRVGKTWHAKTLDGAGVESDQVAVAVRKVLTRRREP